MKKLIYLLPVLFLASCSPSLQAGGWLAVALPSAGFVIFGALSLYNIPKVGERDTKYWVYSLVCLIAAIVIYFLMQHDK